MGNWATLPLVFGIMAFVYSGHGVFPSVRASMKRPQLFPKVPMLIYSPLVGFRVYMSMFRVSLGAPPLKSR